MHRTIFALIAVAVGTALLLGGQTALALMITVDSLTDDFSDDGQCTLREAIQNANDTTNGEPREDCAPGDPDGEDTIEFSVEGTITLSGPLPPITDDLVITGGNVIVVDGDGGRILSVEAFASLLLEELELVGGQADSGGAIYVEAGSVGVTGSRLSNNQAGDGGAIFVSEGNLSVSNSVFEDNEASDVGGAIFVSEGNLSVTNSVFEDNIAQDDGGAIIIVSGGLQVAFSTFAENEAVAGGAGAIGSVGAPVTVVEGEFNGNSAVAGGAIVVQGAPLSVQGTSFVGNTGGSGGAIFSRVGSGIQVDGATFDTNTATTGGGGAITSLVPLTVTGSFFGGNQAPRGGAIDHTLANASIASSLFTENFAMTSGGAVYLGTADDSTAVIGTSTFSENLAEQGGAVYVAQGSAELVESTFSENSAIGQGGAIYNKGMIDAVNSTVSANSATLAAGGLYNEGTASIRNTTLAFNAAPGGTAAGILNTPSASIAIANSAFGHGDSGFNCDLEGTVSGPAGSNLSDDASCDVPGFVEVADLMLGPLGNNGGPTQTHLPADESPVVDAGADGSCLDDDQRGQDRISGGGCDIGSVELQLPNVVEPSGDLFLPNLASQVDN